ncbi:hypothetical protein M9Y10_011726 [Tritrichomonas musculus]|uniref:Uncharacterized protein n=1 Tax=Tritrichomonas musculus TaxID=1915356 RepID=A0ABR2GNJ3_9EUKA
MKNKAALAATTYHEPQNTFDNIFSNIQSKLSEFEEVKKTVPIENDSFFIQDIKYTKDSINNALQTSEILSKQRERETQLLDQWLRIVKIQQEMFKPDDMIADEINIPSIFKNFNSNENGLENLSNDLCNILREILTNKETPEATRLSQIYLNAKNDYQNRSDLLEQMTNDVFRAQSKLNSLTNENCSLSNKILELQEYTNTFSDTNSYDAIQKAKKIKLAKELAHKKEAIMNKQIEEMEHEMDILHDSQESYNMVKKQICRNEKEYRKKIGDYEKEMMLLKQEISNLSQNSSSLFSSLNNDLQNARESQLLNEKNLTENQFNQIKMVQERLFTKFLKDESESAHNMETILKNNQQDPFSPMTIDQQNSISRRKAIFPTLINELREISQTSQKVKTTDFENQIKIIRTNQQTKSTALKSYLNRMKTDLVYRESEIATVKSQCLLVEDLTYDIMEIAIKLIGEYETEERITERTQLRIEVQKFDKFISKGDHITRKLENFMGNRIETAKEQLIIDGSFNSRPNSSLSSVEKRARSNKEINIKNGFTLYNFETRTDMKRRQKVRIPELVTRRGPVTDADLEPDEFEEYKYNKFVISDGKIGYLKSGKFVEVDTSQYDGKTGYFKDGAFIPFDPSGGIPEGLPDGTFVILNGQPGYIKDGKFIPCNPSKGVIPDGTQAFVNGVEGRFIDGKFVPNEDQNGVFIDGKFVPLDQIDDPSKIKDGTLAVVNGQKGIFKDGKFVPFDEDKLSNLVPPGAELVNVDGRLGYYDKDGNFVEVNPDEVIQKNNDTNSIPKNGIFINGKFVEFDPEKGIPEDIPDGTFGIINGQPGVFQDGKFVPCKNGYIDSNGNFVEFNENDGIPSDLPEGTVVVFKGKTGRIIDGKFVPDEEEGNEKDGSKVNGYFDKDGNFHPFDSNADVSELISSLPEGTTIVLNGVTGVIKDGKFVPTDPSECDMPQNGYFTKDGKFVAVDPNNIPDDIPDGTVMIINGQLGVFKDGKFVPNKSEEDEEDNKTGYFDANGNFVPFNPEDGIPNVPDGTIGIVNGHRGIFKNGKFIPIEGNIFPDENEADSNAPNGYYDEEGNFIAFEGDDIPFDKIPDGTVGFFNGKKGIFKNGQFIPFTDDQLQQKGSGYYDSEGNFIPIDPDQADFSGIPDGTFGVINGQQGVFRNGQFIPFKPINPNASKKVTGIGRPGYIDDDGNFIPMDPNDPNFPANKKVVFMMNDGTVITQEMMRRLYPGLADKDIYNRLRYGRFRKHSITPYRKGCPDDDSCNYEWFSKCPREDPDWVPDPLYRIQPLKFKFPDRSELKKKKVKPKPELTPEQLRALIANSPYVQFDPETAAKFMNGQNGNNNFFGICNFKKNERNDDDDEQKSPRRGRALATSYANGRRNQKVSRSGPPQKDSLFIIKSSEQKKGKNILPLNSNRYNSSSKFDLNDDMNYLRSGDFTNSRTSVKSAYQKMRSNLNMRTNLPNEIEAPPLDDFQRKILSSDEPNSQVIKRQINGKPTTTKINKYKSYAADNDNDHYQSDSLLKPSLSSINNNEYFGDKIDSPRRLIDANGPKLIRPLDRKNPYSKPRSPPRSPRRPIPSFDQKING